MRWGGADGVGVYNAMMRVLTRSEFAKNLGAIGRDLGRYCRGEGCAQGTPDFIRAVATSR